MSRSGVKRIFLILIIFLLLLAGIAFIAMRLINRSNNNTIATGEWGNLYGVLYDVPSRDWLTMETSFYTVKYPPDWYFRAPVLYGFDPGEFVNLKRKQEIMKDSKNPIMIRFDVIYANDEKPKMSFEEQQEEWYLWIRNHIDYLESDSGINIVREENIIVDGVESISYELCIDKDRAINKDYTCKHNIFIPHGDVGMEVEVSGDLELMPIVFQILSSFKFKE